MSLLSDHRPARFVVSRLSLFAAGAILAGQVVGPIARGADSARTDEALVSQPFAPRSKPRGATMFTALAPADTGIVTTNPYNDPRMWAEKDREFALGSLGTGIAIGDYDSDGRPDILVVGKTEPCRLFRNLGNWKFEDVSEKAGIIPSSSVTDTVKGWFSFGSTPQNSADAWKQGAAFADVNNDGRLDLYVCRFGAPNWLFINQGNGTFKEEAAARGLALSDASGMGAFCDYDRDGWLDVYLHTNMLDALKQPNGQRDHLFRNRGDGTFEDVTLKAGISSEPNLAHSATWWDYNDDGWPDLYVANDFGPPDRLYRNNRNGTFTDVIHEVLPHMPYSSMGSDLGDINNDGRIDFLATDMAARNHERDQRTMAAARTLTREDSDSPTLAPQALRNTVFLNTGVSRFLEAGILTGLDATDWTWSVRLEDLDNDGRLDLHVTNGMVRELHNVDLRDRLILLENAAERQRVMRTNPEFNEVNLAYRNTGDLRFEEIGKAWGLDQMGISLGAAFGDLDGDGDLDLVFSNYNAGATVLRNDSQTGHRVVVALRGKTSNRFALGAMVHLETSAGVQVRPLVGARGYMSSSEPVAHFGLGEAVRITSLTVEWPSGHRQTFRDLPVDCRFTITEPAGRATIAAPAKPEPGLFVDESTARNLALKSEETFHSETQPLLPFRFDRRGPALAVGDLNGDHVDDVVLGGTGRQPARILIGGERFSPGATLAASPLDDGPLLLMDADGDGDNDLLQTKAGTNQPANSPDFQPTLHVNDGTGRFRPAAADALPPFPVSVGAIAAADFDRDGRLDVFLGGRVLPGRYPLPPRSALWRNLGGRFADATELAPGLNNVGLVTSALWSDVDADGWIDLLVALEWGTIKYFHNDAGRGFTDRSASAGFSLSGWWTSLASADFNHDGKPDFVAGNLGLNTMYRASPEHPAVIFHGTFGGGAPLVIEAYYEGDRLYPRRTRNDLGARISTVARRYPKNDDYAKVTLPEILGADRIAAAQRFEAAEFRSGVYLSQPDGRYRFSPLPRIAQISPLQGIVAGDLDGDGHADIYAVQNSYAPVPSIGRFDGGLSQLLLGDGKGGFRAIEPAASGLVVPGDAKALAVLDFDGDNRPDFLLSQNDKTTLAWRNRTPAGHSVRVLLSGPPGNPSAVGARLELELADGSTQTAEVQAGSGYYSQSTSAVFFGHANGNPPRQLRVRWPDGRSTAHEVPSGTSTLTVTAPAR